MDHNQLPHIVTVARTVPELQLSLVAGLVYLRVASLLQGLSLDLEDDRYPEVRAVVEAAYRQGLRDSRVRVGELVD